jgi:hypothetical protein
MSVADPKCYVRLREPIPGIDHIKFIDRRELADAHHLIDIVASQIGVDGINQFYAYQGEHGSHPVRWHDAVDGLNSFERIQDYIESHESLPTTPEHRDNVRKVLGKLILLLFEAKASGTDFCIVGNY